MPLARLCLCGLVLLATLHLISCSSQDRLRRVTVDAQYAGLANKRVAVLVSADDQTLFHHPEAPRRVCRAVSARIVSSVPGVKVTSPDDIAAYQKGNPYWSTKPYGDLLRELKVDRLVYIDLGRYATHDPGNAHVWRGTASGNVGVAEAEAAEPNNFVFYQIVEARFPEDRPLGVLQSDDETIELGMLTQFASNVTRLFHQYETMER